MSTVSSTSSYTSTNRITGMVSGLDTDSIVEQLMAAEKVPLNKLEQKKQLAEWKQEAYREVISMLKAFSDEYFDYTNSSTNMLSASTYLQFFTTSTDESVVTVSASSSAEAGSHTIVVSQLATAASYESSSGVTKTITASSVADFTEAAGTSLVLEIDGTDTTITLDDSITDIDSLQDAIDEAVGSGKILVSDTNGDGSGYLTISKVEGSGIGTIVLSNGDDSGALSALGFSSDDNLQNYLDTTDTLETISSKLENAFEFDSEGNINLTINGGSFTFSKSTTLKEMMKEINSSDAGVTIEYSTESDSFTITADSTGAGNKIVMSESGSTFLEDVGITDYTAGKDAIVTIDGEKVTRDSNSITLDGVTYSLKAESTETQTVSVSMDTDAVYDMVETFINDYNSLIESINEIISEEYDRDYAPLTDDQKEEMTEDEIEAWEEKAKTGLLEDDSTLTNMLSEMRLALYQSVSGVSTHLTEIGITTSSEYEDNGKLIIDEDTLKAAIESDPESVMNLFSQESESYNNDSEVRTLTSAERKVRTSEEGLAYRLYDILQDNISTYTDSYGNKGTLLEKAGMEGDGSEYDNILTSQISKYDDEIETLMDKLDDKEDYYYEKFSLMETYISQMNTQLSVLQSYLG